MPGGSLGSLTVDLVANIARFERALTKAEKLADKRAKGIKRTFVKLSTGIGAALATFGFVRAVEGALEFADAIGKAADRAGIGTTKLQELRFAADQLGISTQQLDDGMRRFTRRLGVALQGGSFAKDFDELGVAIRDVENNVRSSEEVFDDVARGIANLGSVAEQSKVAAQLFGDDAGPQLALLLRQGEDGIRAFADEARRLGLVMDDNAIRKAEAANDELSKLAQVIKIQLVEALVQAAPALEKAGAFLADFIAQAGRLFGGIEGANLDDITETIDRLADNLVTKQAELAARLSPPDGEGLLDMAKVFFGKDEAELRGELAELEELLVRAVARKAELLEQAAQQTRPADEGDDVNFLTQKTIAEMEKDLEDYFTFESRFSKMQEDAKKTQLKNEQQYEAAVYAARSNAFNQGVNLLRKFAGENEALNAILIALQTAKAVKDIQIQGRAAQAQVLAYGQIEAAAHSALFNYAAAGAAIARSQIAAASIEASTQLATAFAVASGVADLADIGGSGANAPLGAPGNPIATTPVDAGTFAPAATTAQNTGTISIYVNGVITDEIINDLVIPAIQDSVDNKDVILISGDSRNALELS